jgi:aspartyl-tRNA(Asn)/glutamyl-tRNA(Gln) amidotransferase subunit B
MNTLAPVIGLEIHVQLKTASKLFCGDTVVSAAPPNSHVCPVCLGLPGALPMPNRRAVELGVRAATALACTIHQTSRFVRKNYFYPDLPKGYQITQYGEPLATGGQLSLKDGTTVRIRRMHLEEDAGKLLHSRFDGQTAIDMNRAGVALLEIVTEPDLTSPAQARAWLTLLKRTLQYIDVSDCEMEKGSLRVDANVSLLEAGTDPARAARTELKNLNSFAAIERALHAELERQAAGIATGEAIGGHTLAWDDVSGELHVLREKEATAHYRYMQEPDLPPLRLGDDFVEAALNIIELPLARAARFETQYGLRPAEAGVLTASRPLADYFEALAALTRDAHGAAVWTMREVLSTANAAQTEFAVSASHLAELIALLNAGVLSTTGARAAYRRMSETGRSAHEIVALDALDVLHGSAEAEAWTREIVAAHEHELARLRNGEAKLFDFFVGQLMRKAKGRIDHRTAREAVARMIQAGE